MGLRGEAFYLICFSRICIKRRCCQSLKNFRWKIISKISEVCYFIQFNRETGICPIREELLSQCFDEIIRQVTINCPERGINFYNYSGLLLMRVRDELKMTIAAY